jgi:YVTN family beta-propeller protein
MRKAIVLVVCLAAAGLIAREAGVFSILKSDARIGRQEDGVYLVPTNQLLRPWGEQTPIQGRPVDLAFDSKKRVLAVLNWRGVLFADASSGARLAETRTLSTSYTGIAFRPGDRELWVSETARNGPDSIAIIEIDDLGRPGKIDRIKLDKGHPLPAGIAFSADGATAYVAFSRSNTVATIDAAGRKIVREIEVGMAPFSVALATKHDLLFVTNRAGRRPKQGDTTAPSSGSNVVTDGAAGFTTTGTVSVINLKSMEHTEVAVGSAPSQMALSPDQKTLAVANAHSDTVSLLDTASLGISEAVIPAYPEGSFGSQPVALAFAADGQTLYVACGGTNAIAVLRPAGRRWTLAGLVPTGYFPSALALGPEGALRIVNIKGNANTADGKGTFNSRQYEGSLTRVPAPLPAQLAAGLREVRAANAPQFEPAGGVRNPASLGIQHVFFIIKENRTYDQVFGDMGKGDGDPKLCMYGRDITPNHHALADRYVLLDNFHTGGAISFDGHQWLMQGFVSDYVERAFASSPRGYAWNMSDAMVVPPTGFFWQSAGKPLDVRIYGEFSLPARWDAQKKVAVDMDESQALTWSEYWRMYKEGTWRAAVASRCGVPALERYIDPQYPFSSTSVPDQMRADEFLREFAEFEKTGRLAQLNIIHLNSDHTNGTRPGSPRPHAMVADNDLALGRMVEAISKSRFWAKSLILVVEDDAQDGVDHVDGHRTVALAIGPNIRRNAVDSNHYNHTSMVRTIQEILRIPPRTRALASARAMTSVFTAQADPAPYRCLTPQVALDEMNPPLKALTGRQLWAARQSLAMNWNQPDDIPQDTLNRILWGDAKGWNTPYPRLR